MYILTLQQLQNKLPVKCRLLTKLDSIGRFKNLEHFVKYKFLTTVSGY